MIELPSDRTTTWSKYKMIELPSDRTTTWSNYKMIELQDDRTNYVIELQDDWTTKWSNYYLIELKDDRTTKWSNYKMIEPPLRPRPFNSTIRIFELYFFPTSETFLTGTMKSAVTFCFVFGFTRETF